MTGKNGEPLERLLQLLERQATATEHLADQVDELGAVVGDLQIDLADLVEILQRDGKGLGKGLGDFLAALNRG